MILIDTSAWYALVDGSDPRHAAAAEFFGELRSGAHGRMVTTDYVLAEAYTLLRMHLGLPPVRQLSVLVHESPSIELLWIAEGDHARALQMMLGREDKKWSFTDCTSFVLMDALDIHDAFTFDRNFTQAGFVSHPQGEVT